MKSSDITAVDFFCGCGGSTTGAVEAGVRVTHAVNHEQIAIASHNTNYPDTDHDCVDVTQVSASRYPEATLGLFSPECGGHGTAAGKKRMIGQLDLFEQEQADIGRERSRMTIMEVYRQQEVYRCDHCFNIVEPDINYPDLLSLKSGFSVALKSSNKLS
jgi:DNA (cytosine-5)-methyltransferase 1